MTRIATIAFCLFICASTVSRGEDLWTLRTADFANERVLLRGFESGSPRVSSTADAALRTIGQDQFLSLVRIAPPRSATSRFIAVLNDGDRYAGEPVGTAGEIITWNTRALGPTKISMRQLNRIVRTSAPLDRSDDDKRTDDTILLANGDTLHGILTGVSAANASIQPTGGEVTPVPMDSVVAILLAPSAPAASDAAPSAIPPRGFRLTLNDSSSITTTALVLESGMMKLPAAQADAPPRTVPIDSVVSIEQINGPVIWLSAIKPTENIQIPFLDLSRPTRFDENLEGDPIQLLEQTYAHGIGVHAYSRLSFPLDATMQAFRTQYAIDGDQPFANVTVRIKLDGKTAYEKPDVQAGVLSPVISLETAGAKTLTLEVDYGKNQDVQDRFNWIEPALLRYKPPANPASQPSR